MLWRVLAAVLLLTGCPIEDTAPAPPHASIPEPILPTAAATSSAAADSAPAWASALPDVAPSARKGQRVWATIPRGDLPRVGVFTVEGIYDGLYSLTDAMGQRVDRVPASLVHRAARTRKLQEGEVVFFYTKATPGLIGRVSEIIPGGEINVRYDAAGTTRQTAVDHAETPLRGLVALAFVSFPKAGRQSRGLLVALSAEQAWVRTSSGHVEMHPRAKIKALPTPLPAPKVGSRVRAYAWATGIQTGVVTAVIEPSLRYRIKVDDTATERGYFFSSVFK